MLNLLLIYVNSLYIDLTLVFGPHVGDAVKLGVANHVGASCFFTVTSNLKNTNN